MRAFGHVRDEFNRGEAADVDVVRHQHMGIRLTQIPERWLDNRGIEKQTAFARFEDRMKVSPLRVTIS